MVPRLQQAVKKQSIRWTYAVRFLLPLGCLSVVGDETVGSALWAMPGMYSEVRIGDGELTCRRC